MVLFNDDDPRGAALCHGMEHGHKQVCDLSLGRIGSLDLSRLRRHDMEAYIWER